MGLAALLDVAAHAEVAVADREQRLGDAEVVSAVARPRSAPTGRSGSGSGRAGRSATIGSSPPDAADHGATSSARSATTRSAPASRQPSAPTPRSTPTTRPKPPARPASTPDSASSTTTARSRRDARAASAAYDEGVGRRLAGQAALGRRRRRRRRPRTGRPARPPRAPPGRCASEETTAILVPRSASCVEQLRPSPGTGSTPSSREHGGEHVVLAVAEPAHGLRRRARRPGRPRAASMPREARNDRTPS